MRLLHFEVGESLARCRLRRAIRDVIPANTFDACEHVVGIVRLFDLKKSVVVWIPEFGLPVDHFSGGFVVIHVFPEILQLLVEGPCRGLEIIVQIFALPPVRAASGEYSAPPALCYRRRRQLHVRYFSCHDSNWS